MFAWLLQNTKMENKTDKELLITGLKRMIFSLIFMFLGPIMLYITFSNKEKPLYIPLFFLGIIICGMAIYFAFNGIKIILDSMFKNKSSNLK